MINSIGLIESRGLVALVEAADVILKNSPAKILGIHKLENGLISMAVYGDPEYVKAAVESAVISGNRVGEIYASSVIDNPNEELLNLFGEIFDLKNEKISKAHSTIKQQDSLKIKSEESIEKSEPMTQTSTSDNSISISLKKEIATSKKTKNKKPIINKIKEKKKLREMKIKKIIPSAKSNSTIERLRMEALGLTEKKMITKPVAAENKKMQSSKNVQVNSKVDFDLIKKLNVHKLRHYARGFENFPIKGREISRANRDELVDLFKTIVS